MKYLKKFENINNKRAVILKGDDWQAFYIDGECVDQMSSLGEGYGLLHFLQEQSKKYNFGLHDIEEFYAEEEDMDIANDIGNFPNKLSELKGKYKKI